MPPPGAVRWQCRAPVADVDDQEHGGIRLDDGTWVDVGPDGRWRPTAGERARAAVILGLAFAALLLAALVISVGGDDEEEAEVASSSSTSERGETTTTADEPDDPASVGGRDPSARCAADDRDGAELRGRRATVAMVLNATSRSGLAAEVSARLEELGYAVTAPGNGGQREVTSVGHLAGWCAEAERLVEDLALPEATVEPVPEELLADVGRARVVVTLGDDALGG